MRCLVVFMLVALPAAESQVFSAIGIAGGIAYGREYWSPDEPGAKEGYLLGFNGAIIAERAYHPIFRWRIEAEYNQLGTTIKGGEGGQIRTNYISLNNYLKIQKEYNRFIPYILIGPRIEYLLQKYGSYPEMIRIFSLLHVTGAIGVGCEPVWFRNFVPFVEAFYNMDIVPTEVNHNNGSRLVGSISYHGFELRVGIKHNIKSKNKCPRVINPNGA